jgi:hypothetical protein
MDSIQGMTASAAEWSMALQASATAPSAPRLSDPAGLNDASLRRRVGEFVGNVFYGTLIRQMNASSLKGKYFHGGRGEEIFQGQLGMEIAKRLGRAPDDPVSENLYRSIRQRLGEPLDADAPVTGHGPSEPDLDMNPKRDEP